VYIENYHGTVRQDVIRKIPVAKGALLDIGGGNGATASALKKSGFATAVVIDMVDKEAVLASVDRYIQADLSDPAVVGAVVHEHGPFDVILCLDILEHLPDPWQLLRVVHDLAAPSSLLVVSLPNVSHYTATFPLLFGGRWDYQADGVLDRTHLRFFTRATAVQLVRDTGYRIESVYPTESAKKLKVVVKKIMRLVSLGFANRFIDQGYIIVARKVERTSNGRLEG
jgi:2-polyprenyl-3-methyl-5-hydroxy-6-metoxy-1,4-benzoquinol methylase